MKKFNLITLLVLAALILAGCTAQPAQTSNIDKGSYVTGVQINETAAGEKESYFMIEVKSDNEPVGVLLRGSTTGGTLYAFIKDANGSTAWKGQPAGGMINVSDTVSTLPKGTYSLHVGWDGPVTGTYDLYMVPGEAVRMAKVSPLALMGGGGMILVALAYILYAALRRLGWSYLGWGALGWVITVAVKFMLAIPLNTPIYNAVTGALPGPLGENIFNLYVGALTGITEVLMVWLWVRYTRKGQVGWKKALAFGIGFGAVEALLLGINSFASVLIAILSPNLLDNNTLAEIAKAGSLSVALAPVVERFCVVLIHIFCNVLLFYGALVKNSRFFWFAFIFKSLLDAVASYAQFSGQLGTLSFIWIIEGIIAMFAIVSYFGIRWTAQRYPSISEQSAVNSGE